MKNYLVIITIAAFCSSCIFKKIKEKEANYIKTSKAYLASWSKSEAQKCRDKRDSALAVATLKLPAYDSIASMSVLLRESVSRINGDCDKCLSLLDSLKKTEAAALQLDTKGLIDLPK